MTTAIPHRSQPLGIPVDPSVGRPLVYYVISQRARGLSIGVNLNPDGWCNFDCAYCEVDHHYPPKIFHVNWFRKDAQGKFLWPGFGDNMRVLRWIIDRCHGRVYANESPLGWMPTSRDIDITGIPGYGPEELEQALAVDIEGWKREALLQDELFINLHGNLPAELMFQRELLIARL